MTDMTPVQKRIVDGILGLDPVAPRPTFDEGIADRLRDAILERVSDVLPKAGERALWVGKYQLDQVHRCEGRYVATDSQKFVWTAAMMRGRVAHRAIEAVVVHGLHDETPLDLIDDAIARLAAGEEQESVAAFISAMPSLDIARLKAEANDAVVAFINDWPPIKREWLPRVETRARVRLADNRLVLSAAYDFSLSKPQGMQARVIIVDFKTGEPHPGHAEDLRFYALVETLRSGVPPFRVASYYLEEAAFQVEAITEELLDTAVRRTADGIVRMARAKSGGAVMTSGPHCRYCPARGECEDGMAYLRAASAGADA